MFERRRLPFGLITICLLLGLVGLLNRDAQTSAGPERSTGASSPGPTSIEANGSSIETSFNHRAFAPRGRSEDHWTRRWREMRAEPRTTARDEDMVTFMEELSAVDPWRAILLAQNETDLELRSELLEAAFRGWGELNPDAALEWALSQRLLDQSEAIAAVFHGLARDPQAILQFAAKCAEADPAWARTYGGYVVAGLARSGEFEHAAQFAIKGSSDEWINMAYGRWADSEPRTALEQITQLTDPGARRTAFNAVLSRWSKNDPRSAAEYAVLLGAGHERTFALSTALRQWAETDAIEAATWMSRMDPSMELDMGAASVAMRVEALLDPAIAVSWAESIVDPQLRVRVLGSVLNEWARIDHAGARQYAETVLGLEDSDRAALFSALEPGYSPISWAP